MFNLRRVLVVLILLSIVALTTIIYRHLQQQSPEKILNLLPEGIDLALDDLHYTHSENGQRRWTLAANRAEYQRVGTVAELEVVKLLYYAAGEFGEVTLQGDHGQLVQESRQITVWGNVELTTARDEQLFTDRLYYDDKLRQLSTADNVRFYSARMELTGTGLLIDIDQGRLLVKDNVWIRLYPAVTEKK